MDSLPLHHLGSSQFYPLPSPQGGKGRGEGEWCSIGNHATGWGQRTCFRLSESSPASFCDRTEPVFNGKAAANLASPGPYWSSLVAQSVKNLPAMRETWGELRRSPGGGNSYPLQYSCLENSKDGGAWRATAYGVARSQTQQSD